MKTNFLLILNTAILMIPHFGRAQILPSPDHIVIVLEENKSYEQIIGDSVNAPYINQLAASSALFTEFYANSHPSQPNYLLLFSGSDQGITDDNFPTDSAWNMTLPFHTSNMGACLIANGYSFKGYAQGLPSVGFVGAQSGGYVSKHAVYSFWQGEGLNTITDSTNQPYTSFPTDFNNLPTVSYVIPDLYNDMHNGSISQGDNWIENNLDAYINWAKTNNSLFILTFDEGNGNNHVATIISGQSVVPGQYSETLSHLNLLRTIEDIYGLCYNTANDSAAAPITNCWNTSSTSTLELQSSSRNILIFPNPFSVSTTLQTDLPLDDATLSVYNSSGQKVKEIKNVTGLTASLFRNHLPAGQYYIQIVQDNKIRTTQKIVITD